MQTCIPVRAAKPAACPGHVPRKMIWPLCVRICWKRIWQSLWRHFTILACPRRWKWWSTGFTALMEHWRQEGWNLYCLPRHGIRMTGPWKISRAITWRCAAIWISGIRGWYWEPAAERPPWRKGHNSPKKHTSLEKGLAGERMRKPKTVVKIVVDILMTAAMLFLMGYQFWGEVAHECLWRGGCIFWGHTGALCWWACIWVCTGVCLLGWRGKDLDSKTHPDCGLYSCLLSDYWLQFMEVLPLSNVIFWHIYFCALNLSFLIITNRLYCFIWSIWRWWGHLFSFPTIRPGWLPNSQATRKITDQDGSAGGENGDENFKIRILDL